jgi:hypothetical protein
VEIRDFQASWRDGLAFCALVHHFKPDAFDFDQLRPDDADANLKLAFTTAERELGALPHLRRAKKRTLLTCGVQDCHRICRARLWLTVMAWTCSRIFSSSTPSWRTKPRKRCSRG